MPHQRPEDCSSKIRFCFRAKAWVSMRRRVAGRAFLTGSVSGLVARQKVFTGQMAQRGCGRQTNAPRSINAELKTPDARFGINRAAELQSLSRPVAESTGALILNSRARTRPVFASTMGTGRSNAKVAMACAV